MRRSLPLIACLAAGLMLCAGCEDDELTLDTGGGPADVGPDDGGTDAPPDAGPDADGALADGAESDGQTVDAAPQPPKIEIGGLDGDVTAEYDQHGILHLRCKSDADCMAALGYFHAANRFFQMDFARRYVRGQLGALVKAGDLVLEQDFMMRHFMTSAQGEPLEEQALKQMDPATVKLIERYAAGVNTWIADLQAGRNGAKAAEEYDFMLIDKSKMGKLWQPADTMAVALFLMFDLGNTVQTELLSGEIAASFSPELAADLLSIRPAMPATTTGAAGLKKVSYQPGQAQLDLSRFAAAKVALRRAREKLQGALKLKLPKGSGSNNWVLGPERTKSKKAILANDPHLAVANPAMFMPVEIDSKSDGTGTIHAAGGSVAGIPFILIGRNEKVAWGVTTVQWDLNEVYIEQLNADGTAVIFNGKEVKILEKKLIFDNAAGDPVEKTLKWVPHHGPLIAEDKAAGTAVSFRWTAAEGLTDADGFLAVMRAGSVKELPEALKWITTADQNFVAVDVEGNIGWFPYSKVPSRPWASAALPPWLPVPGDGTAEWDGFLPMADLPQGINPSNGFFATANQALTPAAMDGDPTDEAKAFQNLERALGLRMQRIVDMIEARTTNDHTVDTVIDDQSDTLSLYGQAVTPALLEATKGATLAPEAQAVVDALSKWKHSCPTGLAGTDTEGAKSSDAAEVDESVGCTAFHVVLAHVLGAALGDEIAAAGVEPLLKFQHNVLLTAFRDPQELKSKFWDDVSTAGQKETRDEILLGAIAAAGAWLKAWKPSPADWQWGRLHFLTKRSPFSQMGLPTYDDGPYANDGALFTVDVADPQSLRGGKNLAGAELDLDQTAGAALRMVVEANDGAMTMKFQLPGGTSLDRKGPRYNQLLDGYLKNEPIDFPFGKGAVTSPTETLIVKPATP